MLETAIQEKAAAITQPPPRRPLVLLAATCLWSCTPKLAILLNRLGCDVAAIAPASHVLHHTAALSARRTYPATRPVSALAAAIADFAPDLIIACDERVVQHLHRLHARTDAKVRALIEHSLGAPDAFPTIDARTELLSLAVELGLAVPETRELHNLEDLDRWAQEQPLPWVLKADGSWGGEGVRIVRTLAEARQAFAKLKKKIHLVFALRQLVLRGSLFALTPWLHSPARRISVQRFVAGRPANCAIACAEGEMLGGFGVEVVSADGATGPAAVVEVTDDPQMVSAAAKIAAALKLSGLIGFDFIIEAGTRKAWLLEMNARATPICHLHFNAQQSLAGPLIARLTDLDPPALMPTTTRKKIALYPQALFCGDSAALEDAFLDVPLEDPFLARLMMRRPFLDRGAVAEFLGSIGLGRLGKLVRGR